MPSAAKPQIRNPNLEIPKFDGQNDASKKHSCLEEGISGPFAVAESSGMLPAGDDQPAVWRWDARSGRGRKEN